MNDVAANVAQQECDNIKCYTQLLVIYRYRYR